MSINGYAAGIGTAVGLTALAGVSAKFVGFDASPQSAWDGFRYYMGKGADAHNAGLIAFGSLAMPLALPAGAGALTYQVMKHTGGSGSKAIAIGAALGVLAASTLLHKANPYGAS